MFPGITKNHRLKPGTPPQLQEERVDKCPYFSITEWRISELIGIA
jgi:hypothetical protein